MPIAPLAVIRNKSFVFLCMLKVFGRKESNNTSPMAGNNSNYLTSHFADVRSASQAGRSQAAGDAADAARKTFQKQKELEKLLMKAENEDISMLLC